MIRSKLHIGIAIFLFFISFGEIRAQNDRVNDLLKQLESATHDSIRIYANKQLGYHYQYSNQPKALTYFNEGVIAAKRSNDSLQLANIYYSIGYTYNLMQELPNALDNYLKATRIYENLDDSWRLVNTYMGISNLYVTDDDIDKQATYLDYAEKVLSKSNDSIQLSTFYNHKGIIYDRRKMYDSALVYLNKGLKVGEDIQDSYSIASSLSNLGLTYKHINKTDEALDHYNRALEIYEKGDEKFSLSFLYNNIASAYAQKGDYKSGETAFKKSISYANEVGSQQVLLQNYKDLADMYAKEPSYKNQAEYLNKYYTLKDSLFTIEKDNQLSQLESDYVIEKKDLELEAQQLDIEKKQKQNTIYIILFCFSVIVLGLLLFYFIRSRKKNQLLQSQNKIINDQKETLETTLSNLKSTQTQLIQSEKMASLGELTAGIAHEIQNPLNFVNNFSEVSNELIDEIQEIRAKNIENRDEELVDEILGDIKQNLEKINHHGKRADSIVKGMLQHSRASSGKKEPTDLSALADEYLRLAYHGLRAKDKSFNAQLVTEFDESIGNVGIIPQDIGRVVLNLLTNAFYAVHEKSKENQENFEPTVSISTKKSKDMVILEVKDNGNGMPNSVKEKIFQPFFTTKPTGQGTGLGLSMSYDIITKGHGGKLSVKTAEGKGCSFKIELPK